MHELHELHPVKVIGQLSAAGVSPEVVATVNARIVLKPSISMSDLLTVLSEAGVTPDEVLAVRVGLEPPGPDAADAAASLPDAAAATLVSAPSVNRALHKFYNVHSAFSLFVQFVTFPCAAIPVLYTANVRSHGCILMFL